jgi:hypothetical protein
VAQGELHDRVHQTMRAVLDALSVFKDGRLAWNFMTSYKQVYNLFIAQEEYDLICRCQVYFIYVLYIMVIHSTTDSQLCCL